jgi:transcriptional regulator with XRE-family HTH domain
MKTFGSRMKQARRDAGLTQQQVAESLNVNHSNVSQWESDKHTPQFSAVVAFCQKTGVSLDWLVLDREPNTGYDKRINDLPEALRDYVVATLLKAETVQTLIPSKFIKSPAAHELAQFTEYLDEAAKKSNKATP